MSFVVTDVVLATAVADDGTVTVAYPSGYVQANFTGVNASTTGVLVLNNNEVIAQADPGIGLTYGASDITLTNLTGKTWAAGSTGRLQLGIFGVDNPAFALGTAITSLTDSSGGTASNTIADVPGAYAEATLANQLASLTAKINVILITLRRAGIIAT